MHDFVKIDRSLISDITLDIETKLDREILFSREAMDIANTKCSIKMNGKETEF